MGRLSVLKEQVGRYRCERSGFVYDIDELVEEESTGLIVHPDQLDQLGFEDIRKTSPRDVVDHHFNT